MTGHHRGRWPRPTRIWCASLAELVITQLAHERADAFSQPKQHTIATEITVADTFRDSESGLGPTVYRTSTPRSPTLSMGRDVASVYIFRGPPLGAGTRIHCPGTLQLEGVVAGHAGISAECPGWRGVAASAMPSSSCRWRSRTIRGGRSGRLGRCVRRPVAWIDGTPQDTSSSVDSCKVLRTRLVRSSLMAGPALTASTPEDPAAAVKHFRQDFEGATYFDIALMLRLHFNTCRPAGEQLATNFNWRPKHRQSISIMFYGDLHDLK